MTIRLILFGGLLHLSFSLVAQVKNIELEKTVVRNIVAYHFRYAQEYEIETESDLLNTDTLLFFSKMWPDDKNILKIKSDLTDLVYPRDGYRIYHFYKQGFRYDKDSVSRTYNMSSFFFDDDYLVAISNLGEVKFLSGNFFKSKISSDFPLDPENPPSFIHYLSIRFYNMKPGDIKFLKRNKTHMVFSAFCPFVKDNILFMVSNDNYCRLPEIKTV